MDTENNVLVEAAHVHVTNTSLKAKQNTGTFVKLHAVPQSAGSGEGEEEEREDCQMQYSHLTESM